MIPQAIRIDMKERICHCKNCEAFLSLPKTYPLEGFNEAARTFKNRHLMCKPRIKDSTTTP